MYFTPDTNTANDTARTPTFELTAVNVPPVIKCFCCGADDIVSPCRDCVAYCPDNEPCKARGITGLRLYVASWLYAAVTKWADPRK